MAALFTVLLGVSAVLLGYYLFDFGKRNFLRETEAVIDNDIAYILMDVASGSGTKDVASLIAWKSRQHGATVYFYQHPDGRRLAGNLTTMPPEVWPIKEGVIGFTLPHRQNGQHLFAGKIHTFGDGAQLLVARDIHDINQYYVRLKMISGLVMLFMLLVILVSFLISTFVVRRINAISMTARRIMTTGDLSQRIAVHTSWDDLSDMAQTLNALLQRIEVLIQGVRDVSDNIAHDLRTPLTRLRNRLDELKNQPVDGEQMQALGVEVDHILQTFNALLRIAVLEKSARQQAFSDVDVAALLGDVVEMYEPLAEERGIVIHKHCPPAVMVTGDKDLLFQVFVNLIDNAVKFSPDGGNIEVTCRTEDTATQIQIIDQGAGIAVEDRARVFDRFYRTDYSRTTPGTGLGLSLVKAVLDMHQVQITLSDHSQNTAQNPGLCVTLLFQQCRLANG